MDLCPFPVAIDLLEHWDDIHPAYQSAFITAVVMGYKHQKRNKSEPVVTTMDPVAAAAAVMQFGGATRPITALPTWLQDDLATKVN